MTKTARTASYVLRDLFTESHASHRRQKTIAGHMNVSCECVANWKRGKTTPDILTVEQLAASLGYRLCLLPIIDD